MCRPSLAVGDKTHEGPSSNDVIIRNNIANGLSIYNLDPDMTMDHNICLAIEGKCTILTYVDGKPNWGVYKPGMHGDHNIIDGRGASRHVCEFRSRQVRLRPQAETRGRGDRGRQFRRRPDGRHHRSAPRKFESILAPTSTAR